MMMRSSTGIQRRTRETYGVADLLRDSRRIPECAMTTIGAFDLQFVRH